MPTVLEYPYTGNLPAPAARRPAEPMDLAPNFLRQPKGRYWHRPKFGVRYLPSDLYPAGWETVSFWCGQRTRIGQAGTSETVPSEGPVCGTCEGRAVGAGYPPLASASIDGAALMFLPDSQRVFVPPRWCPGERMTTWVQLDGRGDHGVCGACGAMTRIGGGSWGYQWSAPHPRRHAPADLVGPCAFHAWDRLIVVNGDVLCECGRDLEESIR